MNDKRANRIFLISLAVVIIVLVVDIYVGKLPKEAPSQPTTAPTVTETTNNIIEPVETEQPTEPQQTTESDAVLFDVPLEVSLQEHIIKKAEEYGVDPAIVVAMAYRESTYNPHCMGDGGESYGLLQIQPKWHYDRMARLGCTNLLDPYQNVTVGIDYLAELVARYGDIGKALTAYNRGHYDGVITDYAKTVLALAEELAVVK